MAYLFGIYGRAHQDHAEVFATSQERFEDDEQEVRVNAPFVDLIYVISLSEKGDNLNRLLHR